MQKHEATARVGASDALGAREPDAGREERRDGGAMNDQEREALVKARWDAGDFDGASTLLIEKLGPGILGMLVRALDDEDVACDVFSVWSEDVWKGLPRFQWRASAKTWCYRLAKHAMARHLRDPRKRRERPLGTLEADRVVQEVRATTIRYMRTEVKDRFRELRRHFSAEDQMILVLHVDRGMAWNELAQVMAEDDELAGPALTKESARLRQRFHRLTERLRELARQEGLLADEA
jgi:RNA polymerase sigma factor (sigma-70 family)